MQLSTFKDNPRLWLTLLLAAVQGLILFRLHVAIETEHWPATDLRWLTFFYTSVVLVPVTIHLLSAHWRERVLWIAVGVMVVLCAGIGWQFGTNVGNPQEGIVDGEAAWVLGLTLTLLWLLCMPFLRCRLEHGHWRYGYDALFSTAWQNKLTLLEAGVFTGAFWLLLGLWAVLFKTLGYEIFEDIFTDEAFIYPFTALTFGLSMHLVGSVEKLVSVAREQILGLLKWLAPVAALILLLFTPTLLFKLPNLVFEGERAIGAAWLLWLTAVTVALLNAAYQNGAPEKPYPRWLGLALRFIVPLMSVVAAVAIYALIVRIGEYGVTVARVYALIVAGAALCYAVGYAMAAMRTGPWMRGIERVNVVVALALIATLLLTFTPFLSPYRFAAQSQAARAASISDEELEDVMRYLQFGAGAYGRRHVERFASLEGGEREQAIARFARGVRAIDYRHAPLLVDSRSVMETTPVYPQGRTVDRELARVIANDLQQGGAPLGNVASERALLFVDLDGDGVEEAAVVTRRGVSVFQKSGDQWRRGALASIAGEPEDNRQLFEDLAAGRYTVVAPAFNDLRIGGRTIFLNEMRR